MILDASALMAIILGEPDAEHVLSLMSGAAELGVSAATVVEAVIVAEAKGGREAADDLEALLADLECVIVPLDEDQAVVAAEAWRRFGKGRHPAALNLGDCFSYGAAKALGRPLLFKGDDFAQTDISARDASVTGQPSSSTSLRSTMRVEMDLVDHGALKRSRRR